MRRRPLIRFFFHLVSRRPTVSNFIAFSNRAVCGARRVTPPLEMGFSGVILAFILSTLLIVAALLSAVEEAAERVSFADHLGLFEGGEDHDELGPDAWADAYVCFCCKFSLWVEEVILI